MNHEERAKRWLNQHWAEAYDTPDDVAIESLASQFAEVENGCDIVAAVQFSAERDKYEARIAALEAALEKADRLAAVAQQTLQKFGDEYVGRLSALEEELIYGYQAARAKVKS